MRKEFLSNVSHELKTPLALIQGYAEGLQECINDDAASRDFYCEVIVDEAGKMNQMVQKLLTLNHLEFGSDPVSFGRFDITELINGVIGNSSLMLRQNGIRLSFEEPPAYVWGDEFQIEEVITNYLSNAIHYASGEKQIRISYEDRGEALRINVFNSGSHIPDEDLDKVWEKFYKVDKARTRAYGGSGIGLSIVKAIMESHHRECGVCNDTDGVVFWLELEKN
jgi:signal transduction histidine kinase